MPSFLNRVRGYNRDIKLYFAYTLLANIAIGVFALVFNLYLIELGQREDYIGIFNALQTLAMAGTAVMMGRLIDRWGIWGLVTRGLVAYLAASAALAIVTQPVLLLFFSMLWGAGTALVFTPVMPFVVDLTRQRQRQEVAALTMSLISVSTTVGSLVGGWSPSILALLFDIERPSAIGFRVTMFIGIAMAAIALLPLLRMSPERRAARPSRDPSPADDPHLSEVSFSTIRWRMIVYVSVGGLMALGGGAVFPFYNVYLSSIGASAGQIGLVFAGAWSIAAAFGLLSPWIATKLGSQRGSVLMRLTPVPLFILLIVFPHLWIAILAHLVRVSSINLSWSMESSFISNVLPTRVRYSVFGYRSAAWNVGFSLSSLVAGGVIVRQGYGAVFLAYAFFMTAAMALYYFYFRGLVEADILDEEETARMPVIEAELAEIERIDQSEAPESLTLAPGRGQPIIVTTDDEDPDLALSDDDPEDDRSGG